MALSQARLRLHAAQAPPCPGVYSFHDRSGKTLYVGKSRNLRQRLASYCSPSALQNPAIPLLLRQAHELRWETTPSELSALLREFERIRLEQPPFNVQGKVARRFGFLRITCERFPRLLPAPWRATDAELWIGPLPDRESAELLLELLQRLYGIRPCSGALARAPHESACLYRELRNCAAPCNGSISAEGYAERLEALRHDARTGLLQWAAAAAERMHALARRWRFEEAQRWHRLGRFLRRWHASGFGLIPAYASGVVALPCTQGSYELYCIHGARLHARVHCCSTELERWCAEFHAVLHQPAPPPSLWELEQFWLLARWMSIPREVSPQHLPAPAEAVRCAANGTTPEPHARLASPEAYTR